MYIPETLNLAVTRFLQAVDMALHQQLVCRVCSLRVCRSGMVLYHLRQLIQCSLPYVAFSCRYNTLFVQRRPGDV